MVKLPTFEICGILKSGNALPLVSDFIKFLYELFPTLPMSCSIPIPHHVEIRNVTIDNAANDEAISAMDYLQFPNGLYRTILKFYHHKDPEGFRFEWISEKLVRLNDDSFK